MIRIDGSYGEGGGQIVRTALALSSVLHQPVEIYNIRKGRKKPGLQSQHLTCVNGAGAITRAVIDGNSIGSRRLVFQPSGIAGGTYTFNVAAERGSAGSVTLVAQTVLPILACAQTASTVTVKGGTHVPLSPTFDYFQEVLVPTIARLGCQADASIQTYGFYPAGGGEITMTITPWCPPRTGRVRWVERGALRQLSLVSAVARLDRSIARRQTLRLLTRLDDTCAHREAAVNAPSPGTYLFLKCEFENGVAGFASLGAQGKPAEAVADEVAEDFFRYQAAPGMCDPFCADQVLIYLALQRMPATLTATRITNHALTTLWVIGRFFNDFRARVEGTIDRPGRLDIDWQDTAS